VYLGITFLAAGFFMLPQLLRYIVICGGIVDFLLGIFLHFSLQHTTIQLIDVHGTQIVAPRMDLLAQTAVDNNLVKLSRHYTFLGDHFGSSLVVLQVTTAILFGILLDLMLRTTLVTRTRVGRLPIINTGVLAVPSLLIAFYMVHSQPLTGQALATPQTIAACMKNVEQNVDSAESHFSLAVAFYLDGQIPSALDQWGEALTLQPDQMKSRYFARLVTAYYPQLNLPQSIRIADYVWLHPDSAAARNALGCELLNRKHVALAANCFQEAINLDSTYALAYVNLSLIKLETGHPAQAIAILNTALRYDSNNPQIHYFLAVAFYKCGKIPEAIAHLRQALRLKPDFKKAGEMLQQLAN
jgi:hypothetical protein